ncbi:MAG: ABC transporter permease [Acidothermales bacterium]|nr:ABC transporter permease [Acidothermales bacterium]
MVWAVAWAVVRPKLATMPSIGQVAHTTQHLWSTGELWRDIGASLYRWGLGFVVGAISGVALGIVAGLNRIVARMLEPVMTFFTAMSGIVWLPLAIVWFGLGTTTVTFVIWNSVFFLVFANTMLGVRSAPRLLDDAARTLGAGRAHIVFHVIVPGSLPHILTGLRSAVGFGWRALIAAEIIGASTGLGAMIYQSKEFLRSDIIVTGVIFIAAIGFVLDTFILAPIERSTVERWGLVSTGRAR